MASEVSICNLGLTKIGQESITALTDNTKAGRLCNLHYESLRDTLLRDHLWNFAIKRVALALSVTTPVYGFAYQFSVPEDSLRILGTDLLTTAEWKVENGFILCNSDTANVKYVAQITDPDEFDILFIEALAARIAAELAMPLTDSRSLMGSMFELYERKIASARSTDAMEGTPDNIEADAWLDARLGYVSPYNA